MDLIASQLQEIVGIAWKNLPFVLTLLGSLLGIHLLNIILKHRLNVLGIYPRHLMGLPGIAFSPFVHASFDHLFFNATPLFILMSLALLQGRANFYEASAMILLISGSLTWLLGRRGFHIGASGLVMGYWGYLLVQVYYQGIVLGVFLGVICLYYLGSLVLNLFPSERGVSWEGHLFGFIAGITTFYWQGGWL